MRRTIAIAVVVVSAAVASARAEPYLAIRSGLTCGSCHVNRTGGGARTAYGASFGATQLPAARGADAPVPFDGQIHPRVRVGADLRAGYLGHFRADLAYVGEYRLREANVYLAMDVLEDRLTLYVDERVAPGGAQSREAFALLLGRRGGLYAKAGRFFLPYGLRLLDDEAATRRGTGFTFDAADDGIEIGGRAGAWSWAASATNGRGGATEQDNGKQFVGFLAHVRSSWRAGLSVSTNDLAGSEQAEAGGLFAGARAGPVAVLAAADALRDVDPGGGVDRGSAAHVEVNVTPSAGWTVRAWRGAVARDGVAEGAALRQRGIGLDWTPWPAFQLRVAYRDREGPASVEGSRDDEVYAEVHLYF